MIRYLGSCFATITPSLNLQKSTAPLARLTIYKTHPPPPTNSRRQTKSLHDMTAYKRCFFSRQPSRSHIPFPTKPSPRRLPTSAALGECINRWGEERGSKSAVVVRSSRRGGGESTGESRGLVGWGYELMGEYVCRQSIRSYVA